MRSLAMLLLLATAALAAGSPVLADEDQCETCKSLVNQTREMLKEHASDAGEFLSKQCEKSPALLKDTCDKVAKSAGDAVKQALDKAYDAITEEKMCAQICAAEGADADAGAGPIGAAVRDAMDSVASAMQSTCEQVQAAAASLLGRLGVAGPFDVACDTCKGLVTQTKTWLKDNQKDVRDFMYAKCEEMKAPEDVDQCKETADQVADKVEAAAQAVIDSLDERAACSLFCPPPPAALAFGGAGESRKFSSQ